MELKLLEAQRRTWVYAKTGVADFKEVPEEDYKIFDHRIALECLSCHELFYEKYGHFLYCPLHREKRRKHRKVMQFGRNRQKGINVL